MCYFSLAVVALLFGAEPAFLAGSQRRLTAADRRPSHPVLASIDLSAVALAGVLLVRLQDAGTEDV